MSAYVEQVFNDVEKMRGKVLADRFRMAFKKIQLVKNDDSDEAYNLKQQENLAAVTELQNAGGFIDWDIKVTKYSNTSTQVELWHKVDGVLVWRDFTFVSDFVFELAKNVVYSKETV
ncbi:hypothetical protein PO591_20525 [Escherichia coli]|uniref:hypothetical protein n=1 Tax=Escherichia coli TaxID=562 RepID=UPI00259D14C9|nr:hypothetical protein [Escherichia coli]MDM4819939.1 hypothetical protein [Escherichia coli]MDM4847695.1 hypothetical protein [Escherichia coli]HBB3246745.1 hypothetical protein [Escherichia coli]HBB3254579.1 hypothetical protein [Escherichia coli]HBB3358693.1 hypothetical protein [Escherichia coli]